MIGKFGRFVMHAGAFLLAIGVAAAASAAPQNPPPRGPRPFDGPGGPRQGMGAFGPLGPLGMALPRLNLNADQMEQIKAVVQGHQAEMQGYGKTAAEAHQALEKAQLALEPDGTIRDLHARLATVEADIAVAQAHRFAEILPILTPEQQQTLRTALDRMQEQRRPRPRPNRG